MDKDDLIFGGDFFDLESEEDASTQKLELREGELREVAVLFADIRGFSSISNLFDAETIHKKMDEIMKIFTRCIVFYGGVVDKYMGDGIMALFGARKATEQDTERAIHAAIKMQQQLQLYNSLLSRQPGFETLELGLRIGINTGLVSVGAIGEKRGDEYTVYGPEVNLGSRMESNAPVNRIMMPLGTKKLVDRIFDFDHNGPVTVKGFSEPVDTWLVKGPKQDSSLHRRNQEIRYIGRETELAFLKSVFNDSMTESFGKREGKIACVSIMGEAGLGKTRLVYEFERAHDEQIRALHGACSAVIPSPLNLFISMFESLFRIQINEALEIKKRKFEEAMNRLCAKANPEQLAVLSDVQPLIAFLLEIKYPDERLRQSGADLLSHLSGAIERFLIAVINLYSDQDHLIVIILDDLHWIDDASSNVLENLLNTISRDFSLSRLFFIMMHRPDYIVPSFLNLLMNHLELKLKPLSSEDISLLIHEFTKGLDISEDTMQKVVELSEGNPFFLEEWCNYIDDLPKDNLKDFPVPVSLHSMILTRLDKLGPQLRLLLHKASVIGQDFFVDILKIVEKRLRESDAIDDTLIRLEQQSLILKMVDYELKGYSFKHITTREVAYQTLLWENRKMLHQITGEAIEELFTDRLDEFLFTLSEHFTKAELPAKAIPYLRKAAEFASKVYNNRQALELYNKLLDLIGNSDPEQRMEIRFKVAEIQWMTGNWKDAIPAVEDILDRTANQELIFEAHRFLGIAAFYKGDIDRAHEQFTACLALATGQDNQRLICVATSNMGNWYFQTKDYARAKELQIQSLELARAINDTQRQAKTLSNIGLISIVEKDLAYAEKCFEESLEIAVTNRFMKEESIALGNLGYAKIVQQDLDDAIPFLERKLSLAQTMNDKLELLKALGNLGNIYNAKGDKDKALHYYFQIRDIRIYLEDEDGLKRVEMEIAELEKRD